MSATRCRAAHAPGRDLAGGIGDAVAGVVFDRLARLDQLAAGTPRTPAEVARIREDMAEALAIWRRLLTAHRPTDDSNHCPACRNWCRLRRVRWPCRVWRMAYARLITDPSGWPFLSTAPDWASLTPGPVRRHHPSDQPDRHPTMTAAPAHRRAQLSPARRSTPALYAQIGHHADPPGSKPPELPEEGSR